MKSKNMMLVLTIEHQNLIDQIHFHDPSSFVLAQRIMKDCSLEEKDALISIANKEKPDEFAKNIILYAMLYRKEDV